MTIRTKIAIAVLLGIIFFLVEQALPQAFPSRRPFTDDQIYLLYKIDNTRYFQGKLPATTAIVWDEQYSTAGTGCYKNSETCTIHLNPHYLTEQRFTHLTLQHEMCHIETWTEEAEHGPRWGACMVRIEMHGAWRNILIDGYHGD